MIHYKKLPESGNIFWDWFVTWYNLTLMRKVVTRVAWNLHLRTGRETYVSEMFGNYSVFDSRERQDINRSGKVIPMSYYELLRSQIWNSSAHKKFENHILEYPRKKNINKNSK
jgi:hypothetical protein